MDLPIAILNLFDTARFMPHKHCYLDAKGLLLWNGIGNFWIFAAYTLIPLGLGWFIWKFKEHLKPYKTMIVLFMLFIVSCGICHLLDAVVAYYPIYVFQTVWVCWTAFISLFTFAYMVPYLMGIKVFEKHSSDDPTATVAIGLPSAEAIKKSEEKG